MSSAVRVGLAIAGMLLVVTAAFFVVWATGTAVSGYVACNTMGDRLGVPHNYDWPHICEVLIDGEWEKRNV